MYINLDPQWGGGGQCTQTIAKQTCTNVLLEGRLLIIFKTAFYDGKPIL